MSFRVALPGGSDRCPACDPGRLQAIPETLPEHGGPRTLRCDRCGWEATFNVHARSDVPADAQRRLRRSR